MDDSTKPTELAEFPVVIRLPIQWGDQDAFGHVNNTVPFRWYESARIAYLDRAGLKDMMSNEGIGPILAAINCNFRRQLTYPDAVSIGARITRIGRSSLTMEHCVFSHAQETVATDGDSTIVVFDYESQRPVPVPDSIRAAIETIEGKPISP